MSGRAAAVGLKTDTAPAAVMASDAWPAQSGAVSLWCAAFALALMGSAYFPEGAVRLALVVAAFAFGGLAALVGIAALFHRDLLQRFIAGAAIAMAASLAFFVRVV